MNGIDVSKDRFNAMNSPAAIALEEDIVAIIQEAVKNSDRKSEVSGRGTEE